MESAMPATLRAVGQERFSNPARLRDPPRACPGARHARRDPREPRVVARLVDGRWLADETRERRAERAERGESHGHAHVSHRHVAVAQQRHRPFHTPGLQVAVRCIAVCFAEPAREQRRRHQRGTCHRRDIQRPCVLAVQQVPGPTQMRQLSDLHAKTVHRGDRTAGDGYLPFNWECDMLSCGRLAAGGGCLVLRSSTRRHWSPYVPMVTLSRRSRSCGKPSEGALALSSTRSWSSSRCTSAAARFSSSCETLVAPSSGMMLPRRAASHARATCAGVHPMSPAILTTRSTVSSGPDQLCWKIPSAASSRSRPWPPPRYLPVSLPSASGPHATTARSKASAMGTRSLSGVRSSMLYRDCRATNGVQPRSSAVVLASATSQAGQSETPMYNTFPERIRSSRARITSTTGVHASRVCTHSRSTYSVPMLCRLASTDRTRFFRWLPAELRSPGRVCSVYLVPTTNRSRSGRKKSPRILSALPSA